MNPKLTYEIVKHILSGFGVLPSNHIDMTVSKSLMDRSYLLPITLNFNEDEVDYKNNIWGCQLTIDVKKISVLLGDLSSKNEKVYCMIFQMEESPSYAIYFSEKYSDIINESSMISCSIGENGWFMCNAQLQATFLAAIEQLKELNFSWKKIEKYQDQYQSMISFIKFYDSLFEDSYEG